MSYAMLRMLLNALCAVFNVATCYAMTATVSGHRNILDWGGMEFGVYAMAMVLLLVWRVVEGALEKTSRGK